MCTITRPLLSLLVGLAAIALAEAGEPPAPLTPPETAGSYSLGIMFGEQMHSAGVGPDLSLEAFERGLKDGLGGTVSTPEDRQRAQAFLASVHESLGKRNAAAAADFLAKNAKEKGVQTTTSGLEYRVLAKGDTKAASPLASDKVLVNYRGRLLDGIEFDSSYAHGQPALFSAGNLIKGWTEALLLMKPGAKWMLWVPPELGYGNNSRAPIPPGSLLVFEVELVSVQGADAASAPKP
jgi:FKBP-type peptidyl-prolyl cis-trans isomerase FklB